MTFMRFSNHSQKHSFIFKPEPVVRDSFAITIATQDEPLFVQAAQISPQDYSLAQDQDILQALKAQQDQRIQTEKSHYLSHNKFSGPK